MAHRRPAQADPLNFFHDRSLDRSIYNLQRPSFCAFLFPLDRADLGTSESAPSPSSCAVKCKSPCSGTSESVPLGERSGTARFSELDKSHRMTAGQHQGPGVLQVNKALLASGTLSGHAWTHLFGVWWEEKHTTWT
jgi:hypothetical protein